MEFIAEFLRSSYEWAPSPGTRRPGHAEHVDVASQYAEFFASDVAGFSLQQRLVEKRQSSKSVLNNILKSYRN